MTPVLHNDALQTSLARPSPPWSNRQGMTRGAATRATSGSTRRSWPSSARSASSNWRRRHRSRAGLGPDSVVVLVADELVLAVDLGDPADLERQPLAVLVLDDHADLALGGVPGVLLG